MTSAATDLPVRQFPVYPARKKYFAFAVGQISATSSRHPTPTRGAFRDRHERGEGSGGRGSVVARERAGRADEACERSTGVPTNGAVAYGKAVWSWHPLLVSSWRRFLGPTGFRRTANPLVTVTRRIRRRGEHVISRKAIAQEMPDCSACTCMLVCVFLCAICTRDRGCSVHPVFPAPSDFRGQFPA